MDGKAARKMLGEDLARSFHSLIADMRGAMFLGEVPGEPVVHEGGGKLTYPLGESATLEVEPIGSEVLDMSNWGDVHRLKLVRIEDNGTVLI